MALPQRSVESRPRVAGEDSPEARRRLLVGIGFMLLAMSVVPLMDSIAKLLTVRFDTIQLVWARYFFHAVVLFPIVLWRYGRQALLPARPLLQLLRGGFLFGSTVLFFAALATMPLADALAMVFIYPFIITALSPLVLGEAVGRRRWAAVAVGFLGTLLIVRPGIGVMQQGAVLALAAGASYACYVLATRKLAGSAPPLVTLAFTGLLGAAVSSLLVSAVWLAPSPLEWLLMVAMGLIAACGHLFLIIAHERAPASYLAPCGYFEIVSASILGLVIFGDFPDTWTCLGIAVVVASGVYISLREQLVKRRWLDQKWDK